MCFILFWRTKCTAPACYQLFCGQSTHLTYFWEAPNFCKIWYQALVAPRTKYLIPLIDSSHSQTATFAFPQHPCRWNLSALTSPTYSKTEIVKITLLRLTITGRMFDRFKNILFLSYHRLSRLSPKNARRLQPCVLIRNKFSDLFFVVINGDARNRTEKNT